MRAWHDRGRDDTLSALDRLTAAQAKLGDTGVDVAEVTVYAMAALGTAGALTMLKRRGEGRYDMMARHAK